jgi:hypothetical protein
LAPAKAPLTSSSPAPPQTELFITGSGNSATVMECAGKAQRRRRFGSLDTFVADGPYDAQLGNRGYRSSSLRYRAPFTSCRRRTNACRSGRRVCSPPSQAWL